MQLLATAARVPRRLASIAASSARRLPRHHGFFFAAASTSTPSSPFAAASTSTPSSPGVMDTYLPFTTIPELARRATQRFADNPAFGTLSSDGKDIDYITYRDLGRRIARCRAGLVNAGVSAGDRVGIISRYLHTLLWWLLSGAIQLYLTLVGLVLLTLRAFSLLSSNRSEWAVVAYATMDLGAAFVPMYETQQAKEVRRNSHNSVAKRRKIVGVRLISQPVHDRVFIDLTANSVAAIHVYLTVVRVIRCYPVAPNVGGCWCT